MVLFVAWHNLMWVVWDAKSILSLLYCTLFWYFSPPGYMANPAFPRPVIRALPSGSQRQASDVYKFYSPPASPSLSCGRLLCLASQTDWVTTCLVSEFSHGTCNSSTSHIAEESITLIIPVHYYFIPKAYLKAEHQSYLLEASHQQSLFQPALPNELCPDWRWCVHILTWEPKKYML